MTAAAIDDAGTRHPPAGADARIVSLVPSLTELLFDLGLGDRVVGRTAFCTEPRDRIGAVVSVGGTKAVNMDRLLRLRPSHAVVNIDETPLELARELDAAGVRVVITHPVGPACNVRLYRLMGAVFGAEAEAGRLTAAFEAALAALPPAPAEERALRALYLIWRDPWMTITEDTYIAAMLRLIGWLGVDAGGGPGLRYPEVALTEDLLVETDLVLFSTEPYAFTEDHVAAFGAAHPAHAAKARLVDGQMLGWYGSRAIKAMDYLKALAEGEAAS